MKTKVIRALLTIACLLCSMQMSAYDFKVGSIYYNIVSSTEKTCGITYGDSKYSWMLTIPANVTYNGETWTVTSIEEYALSKCYDLEKVTIPNSVTNIGKDAFFECTALTSITIPNSVKSIGNYAFSYCSSLTNIIIPNSVTSIGNGAFNCSGLTSITIPNSVTSIGKDAFSSSDLTSITIPNSVTSIGEYAFHYCTRLTSITIPNSVTSIGMSAFEGCKRLTNITIPNSVTSIGENAFSHCSGLTSITISNSVKSIELETFFDCSSLTSVTIPNSVTSIGKYAFKACSSLTNITIPNSVTSIGEWAFEKCSRLSSITIPNSVTSIGGCAFWECSGLKNVTIGNSITSIEDYMFYECSGLECVTIGSSVTSIGDQAFAKCLGLTTIYSLNSIAPDCFSISTFLGIPPLQVTLYVPNEAVETYKNAYTWHRFSNIHGFNASTFYFDYDDSNMTATITGVNKDILSSSIVIPETTTYLGKIYTVTAIGYEVFKGCSGLTSVTIPNSVRDIMGAAFSDCSSLTSITLPKSVGYIGDYAFYGSTHLTTIYSLNPTPPRIADEKCLYNSYKDATLYVPQNALDAYKNANFWKNFQNIQSIESSALYFDYDDDNMTATVTGANKEKLSSYIVIPEAITHLGKTYTVVAIGGNAFEGCSDLTEVTIPNSVASIGSSAFSGCSSLTKVNISDITAWCNIKFDRYYSNPLYCAHHLYLNGEEVTNLVIPDGIKSIENYAFMGCSGLTSVTIPNSVTSIVYSAFEGCTGLTSVTIPNSVGNIMDAAFCDCSSLTSITLPQSVGYIGEYAFYGSTHLKTIYSLRLAPPIIAGEKCLYNSFNDATLYVPQEALEAYKNAEYWKYFQNIKGFDPTGIKGMEADGNDKRNVYYDLNGRRLSAPKKGLNIINGKKVIVK